MDRPYVHCVRVENFRCIKTADLKLTPLHALVGPNDSGKSSLLTALLRGNGIFWLNAYTMAMSAGHNVHQGSYPAVNLRHGLSHDSMEARAMLRAAQIRKQLRLDPDALRVAVNLVSHGAERWFRDDLGLGLPGLYDDLLSRDRNAFVALDKRFCALFPTVRGLRLWNANTTTKAMGITLHNGKEVGPDEMSEGMLYWLAFAIIEHLTPVGIVLIEEPENGLHPARIAEVMRVLREISERTQIIIATHSPLVLNELKPEEVTIVTRPVGETICTPMTETKNFAERYKTYALGELWLAYADGKIEDNLIPNT